MLLVMIIFSVTPARASSEISFHPPASEAELALDKILSLNNQDREFGFFLFGITSNKDFSSLFTKGFLSSIRKSYNDIPEEKGGGRYIDINFLTCEQDAPDEYLYLTRGENERTAMIDTVWSNVKSDVNAVSSMKPHYRMIKEGGNWKLDGAYCPEGYGFNTDFNYNSKL